MVPTGITKFGHVVNPTTCTPTRRNAWRWTGKVRMERNLLKQLMSLNLMFG